MRTSISIQLFLLGIICCWPIPTINPKKIISFYGRISPFEQQLIKKKQERVLKRTQSMLGKMFSSKEKSEYSPTDEMVPIIWTVEIVECDGCDTKYGPKRPSFITQNGAFYITLLPKNEDGSGIEKLVIKIKSADEIPMRKSDKEDGNMHRVGL